MNDQQTVMITKANYIRRRDASLHVLDVEIAKLADHAGSVPPDIAPGQYSAIENMKAARDNAARRLRELQAVSDDEWDSKEAHTGVENAWRDLRNAILAAIFTTYRW